MNARPSPLHATIVKPEQALPIRLFDMDAKVLLTTEATGGAVSVVLGYLKPGDGPPDHVHFNQDEMFFILEGTWEFTVGDETTTAGPGTIVFVPRNVVHRFKNVGDTTARMLEWSLPGGLDHYFKAISDLAARDGFTREQAIEIGKKFDTNFPARTELHAGRRITVTKPLSAAEIITLGRGFMEAKVLLVAVKLRLFDELQDSPLTGGQIAERLGLHARAIPDFPDALVALGVIERDGEGPGARYANTPAAADYLVRGSEGYVGGLLESFNDRLFRFWGDLEEALRTGAAQNETKHTGRPLFEELYREPARLEQFMAALSGISRPNFLALADRFDFGPYRTLCDVGGAAADLSCVVAARHPHLRCTSFDLPVVQPIARAAIARRGLADRVTTAAGDFFRDPLPRADVITMGMILHDWNLEKKQALIGAAYEALPAGGVFIAVENLIDDQRRENVFGLLVSLTMLIEFGDAFDFTGADFRSWCSEAGFQRVAVLPLGGPACAAIAYK